MEPSKNFGNISEETAKFLQSFIKLMGIRSILEIGSSNGYSSYMFSRVCSNIKTIELSRDRIELFRESQKKYNNPAELIEGDALKVLPKLKEAFDLIFIDGTNSDYLKYFKLSLPLLNRNGIIVADNTIAFKSKMEDFLKHLKNYKHTTLNIGEGITIVRQSQK